MLCFLSFALYHILHVSYRGILKISLVQEKDKWFHARRIRHQLSLACPAYYYENKRIAFQATSSQKDNTKHLFNFIKKFAAPKSSNRHFPDHTCATALAERFNTFFTENVADIQSKLDSGISRNAAATPSEAETALILSPFFSFAPASNWEN